VLIEEAMTMKKWFAVALLLATWCGLSVWGPATLFAEEPSQTRPYFPVCEERRDNPTEYDRCVGDEINKQLADMNKQDQLDLSRCNEFLIPYDKARYEACVGEEFNKFPEYGPEVKAQYLAGQPWAWPDREPLWWDDFFPMTTPEAPAEGIVRWWENGFVVTPEPPRAGLGYSGRSALWSNTRSLYSPPPLDW